MPITPFHFGPGAALQALAPRQISFLAFCAANVVIDIESLVNLIGQRDPVHAFMHSYLGATVATALTVLLFVAAQAVAARTRLPDPFAWQELRRRQILVGSALGAYSHILLDSLMHADMAPWAPFAAGNALLGLVSLEALHGFCAGCALLALLLIGLRAAWARRRL